MIIIENIDFNFNEICNLLNVITQIDVQFIDENGNFILQLVNSNIPVVIQNYHNDNINICNILKNSNSDIYYHYINSYCLEYISVGIWKEYEFHGAISIGPFISFIPNTESISDIILNNKLPISERKHLTEFYKSLSVLSIKNSSAIGSLGINLCSHSYISPKLLTSHIVKPVINKNHLISNITESKNTIEARYKYEKKIFNAVIKGDKDEANRILKETDALYDFTYRIPDNPIRSTKDLAFTFNTLLRIAAERGGVNPIYIHNISEKFAIMIEKSPNLPYLIELHLIMLNEYCDLVKMFSTSNYSPLIKEVVDYINLNIENELTLKSIADTMHVNPSHLSRKFKSDTNMTIIDYINQKRVEEAKLYIESGNISFTEIALMVGFNDLNYFGRVFKKITSLTPSQYVKSKKL